MAVATGIGAWVRLKRNQLAVFGLILVIVIALIALAAPLLPLPDPNATHPADRLLPPFSKGHWLGTDQLGRDLLSRLVWGARVSLAVGLVATTVAAVFGSLIGLVAGFYGRITDTVLMRGIDMLMAFPYLLLALAIVAVLGPGLLNAMYAIAIVNIPFFARAVRGSTISLRNQEFVDAARLSGLGNARLLAVEIFPNVLPIIVITCSTTIGWMILETAGLSFLGLGAQPPQADLGSMLGDGRKLITTAPHVATIPGLLILLVVIGVNLLGDGLRDVLDPRLKSGAGGSAQAAVAAKPPAEKAEPVQEALLQVSHLSTYFFVGDQTYKAVDDVSFTVAPGEALGIIGESGSGKSVTALSIMGLIPSPPGRIVSGSIHFRGEDMVTAPLPKLQAIRGNRIAYIFQDPMTSLNPLIPVGEQVAEGVRRHQGLGRAAAMRRAEKLFKRVRLPQAGKWLNNYPHELSGGMRQRVVIAMALANDPDLIIADEPTTALDVTTQSQILRLLSDLQQENRAALILITHDFGVISEMCERLLVMYAGRIVEEGPLDRLFEHPRHPYTQRLMQCVPRLGERDAAIQAIPGLPPAVNDLPPGCHFAPRCHLVIDDCRRGEIELRSITTEQKARCIRAEEV